MNPKKDQKQTDNKGPKTPWKDPDHTAPDEKVHDPRSTEPIAKPNTGTGKKSPATKTGTKK